MTNTALSLPTALASGAITEKLEKLVRSARNQLGQGRTKTALGYAYLVWRLAMSRHATREARSWLDGRVRDQAHDSTAVRQSRRRAVPYSLAVRVIFGPACKRHELVLYASAMKYAHTRCSALHITSLQPIDQALSGVGFKDACGHEEAQGRAQCALSSTTRDDSFRQNRISGDRPISITGFSLPSSAVQPFFSS